VDPPRGRGDRRAGPRPGLAGRDYCRAEHNAGADDDGDDHGFADNHVDDHHVDLDIGDHQRVIGAGPVPAAASRRGTWRA
jgi:hypothetical protein